MRKFPETLDELGKQVASVRDEAIEYCDGLLAGTYSDQQGQAYASLWAAMTPSQRRVLRDLVRDTIDGVLASGLEALDVHGGIMTLLEPAAEATRKAAGGLEGELFTDNGWCARFSKYGESTL